MVGTYGMTVGGLAEVSSSLSKLFVRHSRPVIKSDS